MNNKFAVALFGAFLSLYAVAQAAEKLPPLSFEPLSIPSTPEEKRSIRVSPKVTARCCGGKVMQGDMAYRVLFRSGTADEKGHVAGMLLRADGTPVQGSWGGPRVSSMPDANSIIKAGGGLYLITQFEDTPGAIYSTSLGVGEDGQLLVKEFAPVDLSSVGGTMMNCAGSRTPWQTHLASEENYWLDAYWFTPASEQFTSRHVSRCAVDEQGHFTGGFEREGDEPDQGWWCEKIKGMRDEYLPKTSDFTPYRYGYTLEIALDRRGAASVKGDTKRYAMGRFAPEMALAMPDHRTVYISDDGTYTGFYLFIADERDDLSAGTLYIARWEMQPGGGALSWIPLGHATDAQVAEIISRKPDLSDIFDIADPFTCPKGFKIIKAGDAGPVCLRLRDGFNGSVVSPKFGNSVSPLIAAAFLETRRYGALRDGTTEWNKTEGLAYDDDHNALFLAVSSVDNGMLNNLDAANHLRLSRNQCGAVFRMRLGEAHDSLQRKMHSTYVATWAEMETAGMPLTPGMEYANENACHPDLIANPDNLQYIGHNVLLIGEDSKNHFNNYIWAYDVERKSLTRIASVPTGGEVTGAFTWLDTPDRFYLFFNVQHPLNDPAVNAAGQQVNGEYLKAATHAEKKGYVGYISGIPGLER